MNVIVIPFFLAANVTVNDTSRWNFGSQYMYDVNYNITNVDVPESTSDMSKTIPDIVQLSLKMKCYPKVSNRLLCQLSNFDYTEFKDYGIQRSARWITDQNILFEIEYNKHGVENIVINSMYTTEKNLHLIKRIADQLNLGVSLKYSHDMHFEDMENTSMGNCMTRYEIKREKSDTGLVNGNTDFQLFMLPAIADTVHRTTISIEKHRQRCVNVPRCMHLYRRLSYQDLKMVKFFSRMQISGGSFESFSELYGTFKTYLPFFNKTYSLPFKDVVHLKLISIEPYHDDILDSRKVYNLNVNTVCNEEIYELYE